jgi:hypothetical protein
MVRMKLDDEDFDEKELDVEYEGPQFERYTGDIPKTGTILTGRITKMWLTSNDDGDLQSRLIVVAEQNDGKLKQYDGMPAWEYLTWTPKNSRRYQPFLMNFGLTVRDFKRKLDVQAEDDNIGTPINSIAGWKVGSDDALCRFVVKRDYYNEEWRAKIDWDGWLPFDEDIAAADDEDEEAEAPARPARRSAKKTTTTTSRRRGDPDEEEDEDDEYDDDVEDDIDEDDEDEEEAPPPRRSRRASAPAARTQRASSTRPAKRTPAKRSRRPQGSNEEPPF